MGTLVVNGNPSPQELRSFMQRLLDDVWALETMLRRGQVEAGVSRIGAEQEMVLVEGAYRPAKINLEVLADLDCEDFTTELARFNVEANLHVDAGLRRERQSFIERDLREAKLDANRFETDTADVSVLNTYDAMRVRGVLPRNVSHNHNLD